MLVFVCKRISKIVMVIFSLAVVVLSGLIFVKPRIKTAYESPNVQVHLNTPLFGIVDIPNDEADQVEIAMIQSSYAFARYDDKLVLENDVIQYVSLERSFVQDIYSIDNHILNESELVDLLSDICNNQIQSPDIELSVRPSSNENVAYTDTTIIDISGRYTGYLECGPRHMTVPIGDTDFDQVWKAYQHIPVKSIMVCFLVAFVMVGTVTLVLGKASSKFNEPQAFFVGLAIITVLVISLDVVLICSS